jgi:RNA polymerase sigma factor FliA
VKGRTLGELWSRYFRVRSRIAAGGMSCMQLRSAEREARGLRDRLVVNYSPLVRYVAGRTAGRVAGPELAQGAPLHGSALLT